MNEHKLKPISDFVYVNPSLSKSIGPEDIVSFVPMIDVSDTGHWIGRQMRRKSEVSIGYTPFQEGDILFAKITPCMENGKGFFAEELMNSVGYGSTEFHVLRPKDGCVGRFLYHWLQSEHLRKKAETFMIGSAGQQRVQQSFFYYFQVPDLTSDVQSQVAKILDTIDKTITKTEILIAKLKQIKAGMLQDLLTRGLDDNGQPRDPEKHPQQFKVSQLGRIPINWSIETLGNAADKVQDGTHFSPKSITGPFRYLTSRNVRFGTIDMTNCGWISEKEHRSIYSRCDVKYGDVLLTKDGANTGNAAIYDLYEEVSLLSSVAFIRCDNNKFHCCPAR